MKSKCLILGMGNTLFGDDGAGIIVAQRIRKCLNDNPFVDVEETNWGGFRIIDLLTGYNSVVIIDAIQTQKQPPGHIYFFDYTELIHSVRMISFHDINFSMAVEFARALEIPMPDDIKVFAIEVAEIKEFCQVLSPRVAKAIDVCQLEIIELLKDRKFIQDIRTYKQVPYKKRGDDVRENHCT